MRDDAAKLRMAIEEIRDVVSRRQAGILCVNPTCDRPVRRGTTGPKSLFCSTACRTQHREIADQLLILHAQAVRLEPAAIELRAGANRLRGIIAEIDQLLRIYRA